MTSHEIPRMLRRSARTNPVEGRVVWVPVKSLWFTVHALTEARLLNVYAGHGLGAESYPLSAINFIKRRDRHNGTGNLEIGYGVEKDSEGDPRPLTLSWSGIAQVRRAETLIRENAKWVR